jgi:iron(III) transport system permease protein
VTTIASRVPNPADAVIRNVLRLINWIRSNLLVAGITLVLIWVVGVPIISVINLSFRSGSLAIPGGLTLQNYKDAFSNPQFGPAVKNTLIYAVTVTVISVTLATLFAWLVERTDMPGRNIAWVLMLLPLAMPGMLDSMAWILMLSDHIGILNVAGRSVLSGFGYHSATGPFNIYSLPGMIFIEALRGSSTLFLMMVAAFRLMDPSLEEAAAMSGVSTARTLRKVTIPLALPALLSATMYAFVANLDSVEIPLLIGIPAGIFLLPTLIWFTAAQSGNYTLSAAYTTLFILVTLVMVVIYYRVVLRKAGRFAAVSGKGYRPRRTQLGKWRWPALGVFVVYFFLTIGMPVLVLIYASLLPAYRLPSWNAFHSFTLANYRELAHSPMIVESAKNTLILAVETATITMVLSFLVAWLVVRRRVKGGVALDAIAFVPHAIPSIAIGVALIAFYLSPYARWTHIYGTVTIMVLAMMTRYLAFGTRTANGAMTQLGNELEEAGYMSGVGRFRVMLRITFRLLTPAFLAGWLWVAAHALKNLSVPLLLAGPSNGTIATTLYFYWQRKADFSLSAALGVAMVAVLAVLAVGARRLIAAGFTGETSTRPSRSEKKEPKQESTKVLV